MILNYYCAGVTNMYNSLNITRCGFVALDEYFITCLGFSAHS